METIPWRQAMGKLFELQKTNKQQDNDKLLL
jgi:hypothetical protein